MLFMEEVDVFKRKHSLVAGKLTSREMKEDRPFLCQTCGNKFRQLCHLQQHIRIHTNDRPYKCHFCEKAFKQKSQVSQGKPLL